MLLPNIALWEILLLPFFVTFGFLLSFTVRDLEMRRYFMLGLGARMLGGLAFLGIYLFYYSGGDTIAYFNSAQAMLNLIYESPLQGLEVLLESHSPENFSYFTRETGYPPAYIYFATDTLTTSKMMVPALFISFKSYLLSTLVISILTYVGPWKLFVALDKLIPNSRLMIAISLLFFPSMLFWGCGISKDAITFSSTCLLVYGFHELLIQRKFRLSTIALTLIAFFLPLYIKPYILMVLVPGFIAWFFHGQMMRIENVVARSMFFPVMIMLGVGVLALLISQFGNALGEYSLDKVIEKAIVTQEDLKRDFYGGNSFDIGKIENSFLGVLSKFPIATFYGCYGPTLIHVRNIVMFFSALENTYFLLLTIWVFTVKNPWKSFQLILSNPLLIFCLAFCLMFGFAIGLTTANFGALVRFKIPMIPFFNILLLSLYQRKSIRI